MSEALAPLSSVANVQQSSLENFSKPHRFTDQISKAKPRPTTYIPSKPTLLSPNVKSKGEGHYILRMLRLADTTDALIHDLTRMAITEQEERVSHLSQLVKEEFKKAHDAEKAGQSISNWSYLNKLASCLFAGATMAIGWYLTGNPDVSSWVSYGMVAAGTGSMAAMALAEVDIWPNFMRIMALGAGTLGLVLGGGSSFAYLAGELPNLMIQVTSLGINAIYGISTVGRGCRKGQMEWLVHEQTKARQMRRQIESQTVDNAHRVEHMTGYMDDINKLASNALREQNKQKQQMLAISARAAA